MNKIIYTGYGTNFEKPLRDAYRICTNTYQQFQELAVYFLSDGSAIYPEYAVHDFKSNAGIMAKLRFTVIDFGEVVQRGGGGANQMYRISSLGEMAKAFNT